MGRKRRQRSTAIRKRIEKKRREQDKARKKQLKAAGRDEEILLRLLLSPDGAAGIVEQITGLEDRLAAGPIRGWTTDDLHGAPGLAEFVDALSFVIEESVGPQVVMDVIMAAKRTLLDRLGQLEHAATHLDLDWDNGLGELVRALSVAEEVPEEEEDEEEDEEDPEASGETTESTDELDPFQNGDMA